MAFKFEFDYSTNFEFSHKSIFEFRTGQSNRNREMDLDHH